MEDDWGDISDPDMIRDATWTDPVGELESEQDYFKEDLDIIMW